jgi:hypothetical protein
MHRSTTVLIGVAVAFVLLAIALRSNESNPDPATTATAPASTTLATTTTSTLPTSTTTIPAGTAVCDLYGSVAVAGTVPSPDLVEASGIAASRTTSGVLWSHNDSRGSATLYAFTTSGVDLGSHDVPDAFALDWEDMSAGPGPNGDGAFLYVGDIGDNFEIRDGLVAVYRVVDADPTGFDDAFPESVALTYRYPDGAHNAEALFVDPVEPALYIITKDTDQAFVFRGTLEPSDGPIDLELVTTLFLGAEVSAADMSADGATLAVRGYQTVWMWHRDTGVSVSDMLSAEPCTAPSPDERQGEAISLDERLAYWTVSEGTNPDIHLVSRDR